MASLLKLLTKNIKRFSHFIALALILLAAWLRIWQLNTIPPGLWFDEAYLTMDAVRMLETKTWPIFFFGNQGYEPMFNYLLALSLIVFGEKIYAIRLAPALVGTLSVAVMYRWVATLLKNKSGSAWLALISMAGLATSFWYLAMNRTGYRANLLLLCVIGVSYFFWRGWQTGQLRYYLLAGAGLGLAQYTYFSARLLPLVFLLFTLTQTLLLWQDRRKQLKNDWLGLVAMGGVSLLFATPLLLFALNHPEIFWERTLDVALKVDGPVDWSPLGAHLLDALRVFVDGQDPNWRHNLLGRPGFDGFNTVGFWLGLLLALRHYRQPINLFLLSLLLVMWLPALLSEPAFHTLRLSGVLPAYYVLMAMGLVNALNWIAHRITGSASPLASSFPTSSLLQSVIGLTTLVALLLLSGGLTFYDYFYRWAKLEEVYYAYDGPVVDLARELTAPTQTNLIIPFYLYTQASLRFLLHAHFQEEVLLPAGVAAKLSQQAKTIILIPAYPPDDKLPPAWVWLVKNGTEPGIAYVSEVRRDAILASLESQPVGLLKGSRSNLIARQYELETQAALALFPQQLPAKKVAVAWDDNLLLSGYEFTPPAVKAGETSTLLLAWNILGYTGLKEKMFIQLLDSGGHPVGQQEIEPISRKMYRWRDDGLILEQHPLQFGSDLNAGLYFARLGFFNPDTGQRLPTYSPNGQPLGDELIVGPLYVSADGINPANPQHAVQATLGHEFELLGYSAYPAETENSTTVELFWKTAAPVEVNYTVFVQMLDAQNQIIAQADAQPLPNVYPTSRWQPGDIITARFALPVSSSGLSGPYKLVTGMYDLATGLRLSTYNQKGELLPDGLIELVD